MQITIQQVESLTGEPLLSIWFGDKQILLNGDEFESLKNNIDSFVNADIKLIGYTTYFKPSDNHNGYLDIHTKVKGKEQHEVFVLKHRELRKRYLDCMKQEGHLSEEEYERYLSTEQSSLEFKTKKVKYKPVQEQIEKTYNHKITNEKEIEFSIKIENLNREDQEEILEEISSASHNFYLELGKRIKFKKSNQIEKVYICKVSNKQNIKLYIKAEYIETTYTDDELEKILNQFSNDIYNFRLIVKKEIVDLKKFKENYLKEVKESKLSEAYETAIILSKCSLEELLRINYLIIDFFEKIQEKKIEISQIKDTGKIITENLDSVNQFEFKVLYELIENYRNKKLTTNEARLLENTSFVIVIQKELFNFDTIN